MNDTVFCQSTMKRNGTNDTVKEANEQLSENVNEVDNRNALDSERENHLSIPTSANLTSEQDLNILHHGNGSLQHFDMHDRPLVQNLETVSPSSSLIADNDIHEHVDQNSFMQSPIISSDDPINEITHHLDNNSDVNHNHVANSQPPPPPPSEQTAREQLIERERQGRLERERARLKQRLAMSRERDEEDEAFAEVDRLRGSIASVEDDSIDIMNLTDIDDEEEENDAHENTQDQASMELQDEGNSIIVDEPRPTMNDLLASNTNIQDEALRSNILHSNKGERQSSDSNINENVTTSANAAALPLGYTMERFLQDGVVVSSSNGQDSSRPPQRNEDSNIDHGVLNSGIPSSNIVDNSDHNAGISDNDSNTNHELVDLVSEHPSSSVAEVSVIAGIGNSSEVLSTSPISHVASSDIGIADLGLTNSIAGTSGNRNERDESFNENVPRLARLTEAEILDLADIDYASVGNMPPRSERDEQNLPSIQDLSGLGRVSNISDRTNTTMQESMSAVSTEMNTDVVQNDGFRQNEDLNNDSFQDNLARLPGLDDGNDVVAAATAEHIIQSSDLDDNTFDAKSGADAVMEQERGNDINDDAIDHDTKMPAKTSHDDAAKTNYEDTTKTTNSDNVNTDEGYQINLESGMIEPSLSIMTRSENYNLPNRVIRPGFVKASKQRSNENDSLHRRSLTTPNIPTFVDDFDYCKYDNDDPPSVFDEESAQKKPSFNVDNSKYGSMGLSKTADIDISASRQLGGFRPSIADYSLTPTDIFREDIEDDDTDLSYVMDSGMSLTMIIPSAKKSFGRLTPSFFTEIHNQESPKMIHQRHDNDEGHIEERLVLIEDKAVEEEAPLQKNKMRKSKTRRPSMSSEILDTMLQSVVSRRTDEMETENKDCDIYFASNAIKRAFPERFFALMVTLIIEIPVLLMISGGSDNLCSLIGRKRYQLLMAFLPLSSAISGNCGKINFFL